MTETLPAGVPVSGYLKLFDSAWPSIPSTVSGNTVMFTLTDGVTPGDGDRTVDGIILDPGGPAAPLVVTPRFTG